MKSGVRIVDGSNCSYPVVYYSPNMPRGNPIFLSKTRLTNLFGNIPCSNLGNYGIGKFYQPSPGLESALSSHIPHVVQLSSKKKVTWFNTGRIIAFVQNHHPFRNWPSVHNPTCSVRAGSSGMRPAVWHLSVPVSVHASSPVPTTLSYLNVLPKSKAERFINSLRVESKRAKNILHINHWLMCRAPGIARCAGAFLGLCPNRKVCQL